LLKLIVVQAQFGDCLLFQSSSEGKTTLLLIDGGTSQTYESDLKPALEAFPKEERKLDLVVLSHIDNDHVLGLLDLFEDIKKSRVSKKAEIIKIESLWHNSFSDIVGEQRQNGLLINERFLSGQFSLVDLDGDKIHAPVIGALKGVGEGRDLRKLSQSLHIPINQQFGGDLIVARDTNKSVKIGNIKFSILGPTQKNLDKLRKLWNDWLRKHDKPLVTAGDFRGLQALDASIANLSSIMFIAESQGKKILFTGDGLGDDAVDVLSERKLLDSEDGYHVDVLKVPHHGSERNASPEFFNTVTADAYVISANGRDDNPSLSTLKWIIESKRKKDKTIKIFLTNKTDNTDKILKKYDEQKFQYRFNFLSKGSHSLEIPLN
jgi:glyoxylase-like metal-dependent hydrolase (beta-lactamase superfamily II)